MNYTGLRQIKDVEERRRAIYGLFNIRRGLSRKIPAKSEGNFLLATWNIREFGGEKMGPRLPEALYFIAECLSRFDLIAVQEVRADLRALKDVVRILGPQWDVVYSDVSYADGGNFERMAFIFNKGKVSFTGLAGEMVLPNKEASAEVAQIARTPFICGFQVGWTKFNLCTVHIYYGEGKPDPKRRVEEIDKLAKILASKAKDYIDIAAPKNYSPEHLVLLGDFNIFKRSDKTFAGLTKNKFFVPEKLAALPKGSNVKMDKFYDQIAFFKHKATAKNTQAGIFDFFDYVFNDPKKFRHITKARTVKAFNDWRTYQMSDHLIMWSEFGVDETNAYLKELAALDK
ncbi:MAG: endonuclease/exonuclease/phosphatase family protein [Rhodospirillaceae bacterium]|nr:endonuclease/exonuclease/phosphatase family protein [Rhodospirillaceae bacterium]